ncbi:hypothetical protein GW17_00011511 [Ensete ventricosum]|nr:hypothetical protein GW17_00011511 [Ensete ventricosum]RZR75603.1 hypothetical protein BHM03_00000016 [Ensete ventricosum]
MQVTWVEHMEIEEKNPIHPLFRDLIDGGMAFGAQRWLATLQRIGSLSRWQEEHDEACSEDGDQLLRQRRRIEWSQMDYTLGGKRCRSEGYASQEHRCRPA